MKCRTFPRRCASNDSLFTNAGDAFIASTVGSSDVGGDRYIVIYNSKGEAQCLTPKARNRLFPAILVAVVTFILMSLLPM